MTSRLARAGDHIALLCLLRDAAQEGFDLGRTSLTKIVFRAELALIEERVGTPSYRFDCWHHGPWSKGLHLGLDHLTEQGLVRGERLTGRGEELAAYLAHELAGQRGWESSLVRLHQSLVELGHMSAGAVRAWSHDLVVVPRGSTEPARIHDLKQGTEILAPRRDPAWRPLDIPEEVFECFDCAVRTSDEQIAQMASSRRTFASVEGLLAAVDHL